jgi:PiT family inorganic phosphate transporter
MRTLGRRIIELDPPHGFAAESSAASVLFVAAIGFGAPISTTHTITSAIMGVGATKKLSAVRWGVAGNIVGAWILTFPGAGLIAALAYFAVRPLFS